MKRIVRNGFRRSLIVCAVCVLFASGQHASAWYPNGTHAPWTEAAVTDSPSFSNWLTTYAPSALTGTYPNNFWGWAGPFSDDTNVPSGGKYFVSHLDDTYPAAGIDIIEMSPNFPDEVSHSTRTWKVHQAEGRMMTNVVQCLKFALYFKSGNPLLAAKILACGCHLLQDNFNHLQSGLEEGAGHGIATPVYYDGEWYEGGDLIDDEHWDNHSDAGISVNYRTADYYESAYWHRHEDPMDSWRMQAMYYGTLAYIQAFVDNDLDGFLEQLDDGSVPGANISLLQNSIIDNTPSILAVTNALGVGRGLVSANILWSYAEDQLGCGALANDYYYGTQNSDRYLQWKMFIPQAGNYKIYMRWPHTPATEADAARVVIKHGTTYTTNYVNQRINATNFNLIGSSSYYFSAGTNDWVRIYCNDSGYTLADAVMFRHVPFVLY